MMKTYEVWIAIDEHSNDDGLDVKNVGEQLVDTCASLEEAERLTRYIVRCVDDAP